MRIESEKLTIRTSNGRLEALLDRLGEDESQGELNHYIAVCCHPHSLYGGTLTNKVVYTLSRTIAAKGIPSIRFNFRGVGKSDGIYDEGNGEQEDLAEVVSWMQARYPGKQLILAGFSFGAFVSIMASEQLNPQLLISVAPPVGRFDFSPMKEPRCPWQIIQGDQDELVACDDVISWSLSLGEPTEVRKITGASHFFHGKLPELRDEIEGFLSEIIT